MTEVRLISIIIPALNEADAIPPLVACLATLQTPPRFEVLLVDGGSRDRTRHLFLEARAGAADQAFEAGAMEAPHTGRGRQMNHGARKARGDVLLFLHADTLLPPAALRAVEEALRDPAVVGGGFRHRFSGAGPVLRAISLYATVRSLLHGVHYGDQAMFVRRPVFEAIGGFAEIPLFEDLEMSKAMRARGRVRTLRLAACTSSRRLAEGGVIRTAARFGWFKIRYALGADPGLLAGRYPDVR